MNKRRVHNHNDKYVVFYEFDDDAFEDVAEPVPDTDDGTEPTVESETGADDD